MLFTYVFFLFQLLRYKEGHAIRHWRDTQHCYSLDLTTQQIWDYVGDTYVHRLNQSKIDGKMGGMNYRCMSAEGDCGSCECSEDYGISGALYNSKVEAVRINRKILTILIKNLQDMANWLCMIGLLTGSI